MYEDPTAINGSLSTKVYFTHLKREQLMTLSELFITVTTHYLPHMFYVNNRYLPFFYRNQYNPFVQCMMIYLISKCTGHYAFSAGQSLLYKYLCDVRLYINRLQVYAYRFNSNFLSTISQRHFSISVQYFIKYCLFAIPNTIILRRIVRRFLNKYVRVDPRYAS